MSQELGWQPAQPTLAVSEITFCFQSLLLGNWTLGFQKSWVVETGSPSPPPLPPQWRFQGFLSVPIQALAPPTPSPWWAYLLWTSSNFVMSSSLLTLQPSTRVALEAQPQGGIGTSAWRGSPCESWNKYCELCANSLYTGLSAVFMLDSLPRPPLPKNKQLS